ncbi:RadC family protein [Flagellimonas sp. CMM7]|uniref:JAB domain-containing protein n=1 Tax=Flagellimonas sp. CMM7 TaxID=2654676 RepID=UPI0013CFFEC7|nr:JAB domain-containing protein [Flagellimonas sp. CMM7]UII80132.1 JAB domain-containing protein [Flagellimonas sp. CMM7]
MREQVNEIKVSYHESPTTLSRSKITSSSDAAEVLFSYWEKDTIGLRESFKVVLLNNSNAIKGIFEISNGGITGTLVDLRILFAVILKSLSVGIILTHNHPSGTLTASKADIEITKKIKQAASFFDINLLDHIILTPNGSYYSFADDGLI